MADAARQAEVSDVDAFLAEAKRVRGPMPDWVSSGWKTDLLAVWVVEDANGIAKAQVRCTCRRSRASYPTINLIYRGRPIWRLEIEDLPISHRNPPWAFKVGLAAVVNGSHEHTWQDNRDHVLGLASDWDIPCRRPLQPQIRRLPQGWVMFANSIGLSLDSAQRDFDIPPQKEMF
jgi:hypothetical protein